MMSTSFCVIFGGFIMSGFETGVNMVKLWIRTAYRDPWKDPLIAVYLFIGSFRLKRVVYSRRHTSNNICHPLSVVFALFAVFSQQFGFFSFFCQNSWILAPSAVRFSVNIYTIDVNCPDIGKHFPNLVNASSGYEELARRGFKPIRNR